MLRRIGKDRSSHESSRSILSRLLTWPRVIKPRAGSQAAEFCSLPCPEEQGWERERGGSRNCTQIPEKEKPYIDIKSGSWVIVAEDDLVLQSLFSDVLREKGLHVLSAANGLEALELYRENADKIWLVITDIIMPGMDGLTAAVEMRKTDKNVFFLFMSGHDPQALEEAGVNIEDIPDSDFYQKPFAFKDMIDRIQMPATAHPWE